MMHYNFVRIHQSLRVTPAMDAGIETTPWTIERMVALMSQGEATAVEVGAKRKDRSPSHAV